MSQVGIVHTFGFIAPIAAIFVIIAILPVGSSGEEDPDDDIPIVVTIRLDQKEQHAQVSPGQTGIVTFKGEVKAEIADIRVSYIIVNLSYNAGTGAEHWLCIGTSQLIFSRGVNSQPFTCNIQVPIGTPHSTIGSITVSGSWMNSSSSGNFTVIPDSSSIYIDQYYLTSLEAEKRSQNVNMNEYAEFKLTIKNNGNGPDKYRFDIVADAGAIVVNDLPNLLLLGAGESANFTVKARSDEEGSKKIDVRFFDTGGCDTPTDNITLEMQVKYNIVDRIKSIIDKVREDPIPLIAGLSFIGVVGVGVLLFIGLRTKGFSKKYP